jgi:hypothetical protein
MICLARFVAIFLRILLVVLIENYVTCVMLYFFRREKLFKNIILNEIKIHQTNIPLSRNALNCINKDILIEIV